MLSFYAIADIGKMWGRKIAPTLLLILALTILILLLWGAKNTWQRIKKSRKVTICSSCNCDVPADAEFCPKCGRARDSLLREVIAGKLQFKKSSNETSLSSKNSPQTEAQKSTEECFFIEDEDKNSVQPLPISSQRAAPEAVLLLPDSTHLELPSLRKFIIGYKTQCDLQVDLGGDAQYSIAISPARTTYFIEIVQGYPSIIINNEPIDKSVKLTDGDAIVIGKYELIIRIKP